MSYSIVTFIFVQFICRIRRIFLSIKSIINKGKSCFVALKENEKLKKFNKNVSNIIKRVLREITEDAAHISKKFKDITWGTLTPAKFFKGVRNICFPKSALKSLTTPRGIFNIAVPTLALGLLIVTVCYWTGGDYAIKLSYNDEYIATIAEESVLTEATVQVNNALSAVDHNQASATPTMQISAPYDTADKSGAADVYTKLVYCNSGIVSDACGLYIDDVFYGAVLSYEELDKRLTDYLDNAKLGYDGTTTVSFNNNVQLKEDVYATKTLMSVDKIFEAVKPVLSIKLESDFVIKCDRPYQTITKLDESQPDTYREVVREGKDGTQEVYYRHVYVDGKLTKSVVKNSTTLSEPVDEIVIVGTQESGTGTGEFIWPVPAANNISSLFEYRWGSFHAGIDIADIGIYRADIVASDTGIVTYSDYDSAGYGYMVIVDHGNGYSTMYAHCDELYVAEGQLVEQGDVLAAVGSTGFSTGDHLHFEIWENGTAVNPCEYMNYDGYTTIDY